MKLSKIIQIAWTGLARNKLRSLLTMLGVIIGVAAVIVMISVSAGTEASIEEQINSLGTNLIFVRSSFQRGGFGPGGPGGGGNTSGLKFDDAAAIEDEVSGVEGVVVEQPSSQTVKVGNVTVEDVQVWGTTPDFPSVRDMTIATGRYFKQTELDRTQKVAVLGSSLAEELFGEVTAVGQVVTVGDIKLTVIGVFEERGLVGEADFDSRIYVPITVVFDKFTPSFFARMRGDSVQLIYVETAEDANLDDVILQIELLLAKRHDVTLDEPDFTVTTQDDLIETQESTTAAFRSLLGWVAAVSLIVGGIGIMNIMLVSVTERTREIGIRQSVGATPNDIRAQFLTEALLLSLAGGVLGVLTGIGGAYLYGIYGELRTVILPSSLLLAFTSAAAVGIFFGFYPANQAAKLDPIEALRHE
ncbi:MAG TPA: ABC transporter permease [Anaerolineales bacterium]|nr:ABC transporter permease [Anaerolineales bacterium]